MTIDYLSLYVAEAPMSFALCRAVECKVLEKVPIDPPVLDLGCGDGLFARIFFRGTALEVGLDLSMDEARRARGIGAYKDVVLSTGAHLPFADGTFRTIFSNSVLEHITDLPTTLKECFRVLAPQGKIVATVPLTQLSDCFFYSDLLRQVGAAGISKRYAAWKHRIWHHYNMYDEDGWTSTMEEAGFTVDELLLFNSRSTARTADLLFPLSPPSLAIKKLFGRMVVRPAFWSRLLARSLRSVYERDGESGQIVGTVCIVATKTAEARP